METLFVVTGPTAVGKTELTLRIAELLGVPVINADSRQLYREIPIGTAAPTSEQQERVRHYFVGTLGLSDYYSASKYENDVLSLLTPPGELSSMPYALMSGGSMMYIDSVCDGIDDIPTVDADTRSMLKQRLEVEGLERLLEELRLLDPDYYRIVDRKNTRRVVHALEICYMTGRTYTSYRTNKRRERPFKIVKIGLNRNREELYHRINLRVEKMVEEGLVEEARKVHPMKGVNALDTVGYREMFDYLEGRCSLDEAVTRIQGNTRRYCRKQLTWLKRDERIRWFHPDDEQKVLSFVEEQAGRGPHSI
ncbi:MAG: tRNA (adenosine(37)-N6)-dimethylallyltransferase MiaA [Prevotella sp.]|nr:tRNA (adenosine(37)-N6)-dimethylallyltransferase MiaA [Prevotella sp.]